MKSSELPLLDMTQTLHTGMTMCCYGDVSFFILTKNGIYLLNDFVPIILHKYCRIECGCKSFLLNLRLNLKHNRH